MANHLYSYDVSYGGPGLYAARSTAAAADASLGDGLRYHGDFLAASGYGSGRAGSLASWGGVDLLSSMGEPPVPGVKRGAEAPYHSAILGSHNAYGQSEALFATNPLSKRLRYESTSNVPIYPQRPGEKDCAHYMLTRTCKFGDSCKFDHPLWVPEGGISDWKEVLAIPSVDLPERPGEPDCPYFLKTKRCKFGNNCKFNHPNVQKLPTDLQGASGSVDVSELPERPTEITCAFYMKTGKCKFGAMCKFHHPKDIELPPAQDSAIKEQNESTLGDQGVAAGKLTPVAPAMLHNSKGLPLRPGETDCPFYLKTGSCKYGATCRFNHPDIYSTNPSAAAGLGQTLLPSSAGTLPFGGIGNSASLLSSLNPHLTSTNLSLFPALYPQRPGQLECNYYMKKGECKFFDKCKFHHPIDRVPSSQSVRLTLAGLPRREDATTCAFYMKTGTCKYGANCKFDHPPPGEVIAKASGETVVSQATNVIVMEAATAISAAAAN